MGIDIEASASIGIAIGDKLDTIAGLLKKDEPRPHAFPQLIQSRVGNGVIDLGRCPSGRLWNILTVTALGSDDHTSVANTFAGIYINSDTSNLGLAECRIPALTVPTFITVAHKSLWVDPMENIAANITTASGSQSVTIIVTVAEWSVHDIITPSWR